MRVVLSWLREFAPLDAPVERLADTLSDLGLAVESVDRVGHGLEGVVVARVVDLRPHPAADRVQLVDVDAGGGDARQVVCGAFNMAPGDLVPLATVGAALPNGMEIGRRKVRGQVSEGMLCAPDELGLPGGHDGILVLPPDLQPGVPLPEAMGLGPDVVFDLEVNPNRPDALSHAGVARDLAARLGEPFTPPDVPALAPAHGLDRAPVEILAPDLCGRFLAVRLPALVVGTSPPEMAARLARVGMRPLNSVVDASNYVMLEWGQPNHPYDLARLPGGGLRVRRAREGEALVTLDGVERRLAPDDLLICDAQDGPVGIAGVMGGAAAEIDDATTDVLLEVAWFQPLAVARTSKRLGLRTEASARFERGVDPEGVERAAARFGQLLGVGAGAAADVRGEVPARPRVRVRSPRVNAVLGTTLTADDMRRYLEPLGFAVAPADDDLVVTVPSFRPDTTTEIDVIEEVARHHGYHCIPRDVPVAARFGQLTPYQRDRRRVRDILVGAGLDEAWTSPFLAPDDLHRSGVTLEPVRVANPLAAEESVLRPALLPGLLRTVAYNQGHRVPHIALFEVGHVFRPPPPGAPLPDEREHVAAAVAGADATEAVEVWHLLVDGLLLEGAELEGAQVEGLHPTRTARVVAAGEDVGAVGEVDPAALAAFGIEGRVAWVELDLERLLGAPHDQAVYRPVSRYPSSDVDLALVVDDAVPAAAVERTLRQAGGDLLTDLWLFDVYRGPAVGEGRRSLAYRLRFQAPDRTLTDAEVGQARQGCIDAVESALPAVLRR